MQNHEYEELGKIVKALDDMIHNISIVIEEAPTIILMSTMILPKKMNDIKSISTKLVRAGYNLEYLNIEYNLEESKKNIEKILDNVNDKINMNLNVDFKKIKEFILMRYKYILEEINK